MIESVKIEIYVPLNVLERYLLLSILPTEGTFGNLRRAKKIREAVLFTPSEMDYYGIIYEPQNNRTLWNPERKDETKDFRFPKPLYEFVSELLEKMSDGNKLTPDHLTLYEKFTGGDADSEGEVTKVDPVLDLTPVEPSGSLNHHEALVPAN